MRMGERVSHQYVRIRKKNLLVVSGVILSFLGIGLGVGIFIRSHKNNHVVPASQPVSPVPGAVAAKVDFTAYYPDQTKLPAGYMLNLTSFANPEKNTLLYQVTYDTDKKLIFSLQEKPSANEISTFYSNYIPLHNEQKTPIGTAQIGIYTVKDTSQTLVSLPSNSNTWLIITGPPDVPHDELVSVLQSLKN